MSPNTNFLADFMLYVNPSYARQDLEKIFDYITNESPTTYEKFETLIDRIEFIGHLDLAKKEAKEKNFILQNQEVEGLDWDLDALRLYLSLTCIDILATNFEPFDKWLVKNCSDFEQTRSLPDYINDKSREYREKFQLSSNFSKAFINSSDSLKTEICNGISIKTGENEKNDIESIASYLYRIRNKYTHEGRRFHSDKSHFKRDQNIGPRDGDSLIIKPMFDLVSTILKVAKEQAQRIFDKYAIKVNL